MSIKRAWYIFFISMLPCIACAQQTFTLNGVFYIKNTSDRIAQAIVTDAKTNVIMMSDELGGFSIKTSIGDTLLINKTGYVPQKLAVTSPKDIVIYLSPIVTLPEVTVKEETKQQEMNDVVNTYRSKGLYFDGRPPALLFNPFGGSPITGFYELFSKDARNERHFIKFTKNEKEAIAVNNRYTPKLVKQVTALPDTDVTKFMQQYTPSFEDLKQWNDYELISHIKHYLEYYKKNKEGVKLQKLY